MRKLFEMAIIVAVVAVLLASGIRFVLLSNGATESSFVFSVAGDYGAWNGFMESLNQLKQTRSDFAIALGDLSYGGIAKPGLGTEEGWCKEFHDAFQNIVIVAGNHDTGDTLPGEGDINQFAQYCPAPPQFAVNGDYGKQYYFDYPKGNPIVRFILLSPDLVFVFDGGEHYRYNVGTPRYNWTRDTIDQARAAGIPWVIVGMHKNCIGAGEHACETGPDILNLLVGKKVDLILNAHTHNYERSKQLALTADSGAAMQLHIVNGNCVVDDGASHLYKRGKGSIVVIAGTGGRDIDPFNLDDPYAGYFAAWKGNETPGAGKGVVTFSVDADRISMVTNFNGTFSDEFSIAGSGRALMSQSVVQIFPFAAPIVAGAVGFGTGGFLVWRRW
ncbi:MAG: hypothetical protein E6K15_08150 [Methanobacteriota archaeon]|nr:MAG: hypothetical protein E6K15_08150 [Euryarchaeota archaeon]